MTRRFALVGAGRAYTDVVSSVSAAFLSRFGVLLESSIYPEGEAFTDLKNALPDPVWIPGGPAANTASTLSALGGTAGYFGKVCHDREGEVFLASLKDHHIALCCDPYDKAGSLSGCCLAMVTPDGKRSFALHRGCVDHFETKDFADFDFSSASIFLVEAHQMFPPSRDILLKAMARARQAGCRVILTLQQTFSWTEAPETAQQMVQAADIILGNQVEQTALQQTLPRSDWPQGRLCITTLGDQGVEATTDDRKVRLPAIAPNHFEDSIGAGDAFAAGLIYGLAKDWPLKEALRLGTLAASAILEEKGARPQRPLRGLPQQIRKPSTPT